MLEKTVSVPPTPPKRKSPSKKREDARSELETMVTDFSNLSFRKAASEIEVSPTLVFHVLHDDLNLKPYKHNHLHKLEPHNYEQKVNFAQRFQRAVSFYFKLIPSKFNDLFYILTSFLGK